MLSLARPRRTFQSIFSARQKFFSSALKQFPPRKRHYCNDRNVNEIIRQIREGPSEEVEPAEFPSGGKKSAPSREKVFRDSAQAEMTKKKKREETARRDDREAQGKVFFPPCRRVGRRTGQVAVRGRGDASPLGIIARAKTKKKHVTLAGQTRLNLFARRHPVGTLAFGLFIASPESRKKFSPPRPRSIEFRIKTGNDYDHMIAMECFSNLNLLIVPFFSKLFLSTFLMWEKFLVQNSLF